MAQRDAKQEALHELEGKVLRQLRPQLEEVMRQEVEIKQLSTALLQTPLGVPEPQLRWTSWWARSQTLSQTSWTTVPSCAVT